MNKFLVWFHYIGVLLPLFAIYYDVEVFGWKIYEQFNMNPEGIPLKGRLMFMTHWYYETCW